MTELAVRPEQDEVINGEIVADDQAVEPAPAQPVVVLQLTQIVTVARAAVTHKHTRRTARHLGYIPLGGYAVGRKIWLARSASVYDKRIAAALATGQHQLALDWEERKARFLNDRHRRRMERRSSMLAVVKASPYIAAGSVGVLLLIGAALGIAEHNIADVAIPIEVVAKAIEIIVLVVSITWGPALIAAPWLLIAGLWHAGRRFAQTSNAPGWLRTASDADTDITIDESTIAEALKALRIPQITDCLKRGLPLQYLTTARQEGRGTYAKLRLPTGVTAERIARRRADLATGLYRQAKEVWPSTGEEAGILDLWVADKGALAEGAGPYPLLEDGFTDVFKGVPFGRTLKGDPMTAPVMERNTLVGGMPGQGKSSGARVIMCGAALDPTAELRIAIPDTNFDFEALKPRCSVYIMGAETERIEEIRDELLRLHQEVQARGELLVKYQIPAVTRELASADVGLHPVFFLLEEAHVAITHPVYGKEISGLLVDIVRLGRKRGIHVIVSTQAPTKDSMPRDVTRNCSNGIAYAVGDHVANDALLGQGAYRGGHRATELIPGTDRGIAVVKGFTGERSEMAQCYFVPVDQVPAIMDRALAEIARRGLAVPGTGNRRVIETRDLLTDLDAVLADVTDRVRLADVPGMLRKLAPAWAAYKTLNGVQLRALLETDGVRVLTTGGILWLDPADLRRVVAQREADAA
jgi:S-DNA-T family DNA segregation ATPase FtsK/SpoIIIE